MPRGEELQAKYGATPKLRTEKTYNCVRCGQMKTESSFYESPSSNFWLIVKSKGLVCKNCMNEIFDKYKSEYNSKIATIACCAILDVPYSEFAYESVANKENYTLGNYLIKIKTGIYKSQNFINSFINNELVPQSNIIAKENSIEDNGDNRNKKFALSVVGYDPFCDSALSDVDKKKAYNMLASYCELPNVEDNSHTIQTVIQIVEQQIQIEILNNKINHLLVAGCTSDDDKLLQGYISSRKNIQDCIVKMAENGRQIFVTGHPEYDKYTLDSEYKRDLSKGLPIEMPVNYYKDDDPGNKPVFRWRSHAFLLYHNWMNYYVYQDTPYNLDELEVIR